MGLFSGLKVLIILCSLIRNKVIAWAVGPAGLGLVGLYNGLVDLISQSSRLSIDQSAQREIASASHEGADRAITVLRRWALWLGLAGTFLTCVLSPLLSYISFDTYSRWPVFCLLSVVPFFYTLAACINTENQGLRHFKQVASATFFGNIVSLVVTVPLIILFRINSIAWIIAIYAVINGLFAFYYRPRIRKIVLPLTQIVREGRIFIKLGIQITVAMVFTQVFSYGFVLFINWYASTDVLGIYQSGFQVMNSYVGIIFTVLWVEYYPRVSALAHSPRRLSVAASHQTALALRFMAPLLCLLIIFARIFIPIVYSESFLPIVPYIVLACIGVVLRLTAACMAYIILARGDGRTYMFTEISSSLVGVLVNIAGYVYGGFAGLGIAYIVWYAVYAAMVTIICRQRYNVNYSRQTWLVILLSVALTTLVALIYLLPF